MVVGFLLSEVNMKNPNVEISADLLQLLQKVDVPTATHYLFSQGFANGISY